MLMIGSLWCLAVRAACFFTRRHVPLHSYLMGTASISGMCPASFAIPEGAPEFSGWVCMNLAGHLGAVASYEEKMKDYQSATAATPHFLVPRCR